MFRWYNYLDDTVKKIVNYNAILALVATILSIYSIMTLALDKESTGYGVFEFFIIVFIIVEIVSVGISLYSIFSAIYHNNAGYVFAFINEVNWSVFMVVYGSMFIIGCLISLFSILHNNGIHAGIMVIYVVYWSLAIILLVIPTILYCIIPAYQKCCDLINDTVSRINQRENQANGYSNV
ncbi:hypothetical protein QKU48_gp1314 [Fadolivirus algeromassiliense]|jgi:hypothetical protein|uniref:Uncharacterized protein n=1 Tax=Fadolivirus FV1/VV64 TaxID=3070911 RepID=A0A7D3V625_9VIRU|nr:hypothetical protein QKU48_gp1314 [Fadolivirus algeromassiliense]QKF94772.1 hypothetical protein Fadolivirus_1_1314 [Fadolivirus FV1/VV64]